MVITPVYSRPSPFETTAKVDFQNDNVKWSETTIVRLDKYGKIAWIRLDDSNVNIDDKKLSELGVVRIEYDAPMTIDIKVEQKMSFKLFYHPSAVTRNIEDNFDKKDISILEVTGHSIRDCIYRAQRMALRRARKEGIVDKDDPFKQEWTNFRTEKGVKFYIKPIALGTGNFCGGLCLFPHL